MRHLVLFALAASGVFAATPPTFPTGEFVNGQAARAAIGQVTFTDEAPAQSPPGGVAIDPNKTTVLGAMSGLAYWNGMLFVADANRTSALPINNRVVIYNNLSSQLPGPLDAIPPVNPADPNRCPLCGLKGSLVLGQPDFTKTDLALSQAGMRLPTSVATDGKRLAVADTDNNRVLIWNSIPTSNGQLPDLVLGQPDFTTATVNTGTGNPRLPSAKSLRGPQGVWINADGKFFVADNQNHRVLIWNTFPTQTFQPADLVLGQPNLTTATESDLNKQISDPTPTSLLNPVSVTSDGVRVIVTDLGHNRVLIWNKIPTQNTAPADVAIGQPDLNSAAPNNSYSVVTRDPTTGAATKLAKVLCDTTATDTLGTGFDSNGGLLYPSLCASTLNFPRYALSDGQHLFVADGGNDRVLVFKTIPAQSGAAADVVLGQKNFVLEQTSDDPTNPNVARAAASQAIRTPSGLAWDGTNLYVSEPFSRRVLVFTPGMTPALPVVRNAASMEVFAVGSVTLGGTITENDTVTVTVGNSGNTTTAAYTYKILKADTLAAATTGLVNAINSSNSGQGDPQLFATAIPQIAAVQLTSRIGGADGNKITITTSTSSGATITATSANPTGGGDAANLAAGSLVSIFGTGFTSTEASASDPTKELPLDLGGVQVYVDGRRAPLLYAGPNQINAQIPWEVVDAGSSSLYIRMAQADGSVSISNAVGIPLVSANPGIFGEGGTDPRPAVAVHSSGYATGVVLIDGLATAGNAPSITIHGRTYTYTVLTNDTLDTVRDNLIAQINGVVNGVVDPAKADPEVTAKAGGQFDRVILTAKVPGTAGNSIPYSVSTSSGNVIMTPTSSKGTLCCANTAGALITADNPALGGEIVTFYATGLGVLNAPAKFNVHTGQTYSPNGPVANQAVITLDSLVGGKTANLIFAGMVTGDPAGVFRVELQLNDSLPDNAETQAYIAQGTYISNLVTFAVKAQAQ